jgi:hypothetical protein
MTVAKGVLTWNSKKIKNCQLQVKMETGGRYHKVLRINVLKKNHIEGYSA